LPFVFTFLLVMLIMGKADSNFGITNLLISFYVYLGSISILNNSGQAANNNITPHSQTQPIKNTRLQPTDITIGLSFVAVGVPLWIHARRNPKAFVLLKEKTHYGNIPELPIIYQNVSKPDLDSIINKISNNLIVLISIYGILLAFIISNNLTLSLESWAFTVWTGLILGIILRAAVHINRLSDATYLQTEVAARYASEAKRFFKHAIYFFVLVVALTPSFSLIPSKIGPDHQNSYVFWGESLALISAAVAIIALTVFFYYLTSLLRNKEISTIYLYLIFALSFASIFYLKTSPLDPINISVFHNYGPYQIPQVFFLIWYVIQICCFPPIIAYGFYGISKLSNKISKSQDRNPKH